MSYQGAITASDVIDGLSVSNLKLFGLWKVINDYRTTGKRNPIIKFIIITTILLGVPYIICQWLSYFVIKVDIQKATFLTLHMIAGLQIYCKILVFWYRLDSQCRLYDLIRKDFLASVVEYKRAEVVKIFIKISRKCNMFCAAAFLVNASVIIMSIAFPGVSVDYIAHHTGSMFAVTGGRKKIVGGWYPLPMAESPYYEAIMVYESILMMWSAVLLAVYVCLFYQVLMCLYAQFAVLGYHISTLKFEYDPIIINKDMSRDSAMYKELYKILKDHQKLLRYTKELNSVYNPLVTMILGMGIFVLIIAVFQFLFGGKGSPMIIFQSLQYLLYQCIELTMFCFGSSSIEEASSDLQFAIYSSDWYKADVKFRKTAQMVMLRARKGVTLTAIRMHPVNMETIMAMLQFTYSVAALMSRMM